MPRLPINYSKTIIYKICCKDLNITDIYVGHTTDLVRRRQRHKESCNYETDKEHNAYKYQFIRENGGFQNWSLIPIEEFPCENKNQALIRERHWIEELKASLNKNIPSRTRKEWCEDNKEHLKEKVKEWYENNKEHLKEYYKEWRENNTEHLKEQKKEYYEENKEHLKEYYKKWREENKEKIKEKRYEKCTCECGGCYTYQHKSRHLNTKKHQNYLTQTIPTNNLT